MEGDGAGCPRRGVYCRAQLWSVLDERGRHLLRARAELLAAGTGRVISHESAAARWRLPLPAAGLGSVWMTDGDLSHTARRGPGHVLEVASLRPQDVVLLDGMPVTAEARALESESFVAFWRCGIPLPHPQVYVFDAEGRFVAVVDALWIGAGLVGECDGRTKYDVDLVGRRDPEAVRAALLREKVREDRLRATQLGVVRWGTWDVRHDLPGLARRISAALATGDLRRFTGSLRTSRSPSDVIDLRPYLR